MTSKKRQQLKEALKKSDEQLDPRKIGKIANEYLKIFLTEPEKPFSEPIEDNLHAGAPIPTMLTESTVTNMSTALTEQSLPLSESTDLTTSTMLRVSQVKGETPIPNTILDSLVSVLEAPVFLVYLRLYRLSYGFKTNTCTVGIEKLASVLNLGRATVTRSISKLEQFGLIKRLGANFGKGTKGNHYQVNLATTDLTMSTVLTESTLSNKSTVLNQSTDSHESTNKDDDHDDLLNKDHHQSETMKIYQTLTGNSWTKADQSAYTKIKGAPLEKIEQGIRLASQRAASRPNSLAYFVKEILNLAQPSAQSKAQRKKALEQIVARVRELHAGAHDYGVSDFVEDIKRAAAREGVAYDTDLLNEILKT